WSSTGLLRCSSSARWCRWANCTSRGSRSPRSHPRCGPRPPTPCAADLLGSELPDVDVGDPLRLRAEQVGHRLPKRAVVALRGQDEAAGAPEPRVLAGGCPFGLG